MWISGKMLAWYLKGLSPAEDVGGGVEDGKGTEDGDDKEEGGGKGGRKRKSRRGRDERKEEKARKGIPTTLEIGQQSGRRSQGHSEPEAGFSHSFQTRTQKEPLEL